MSRAYVEHAFLVLLERIYASGQSYVAWKQTSEESRSAPPPEDAMLMYYWLDYFGIPGITVREANDALAKATTLAALQAAVESIPRATSSRGGAGKTKLSRAP